MRVYAGFDTSLLLHGSNKVFNFIWIINHLPVPYKGCKEGCRVNIYELIRSLDDVALF